MSKLIAAPGICILEPLEEQSQINLGTSVNVHIRRGKVLSVGLNGHTALGGALEPSCKESDIVYFLEYENGYDAGISDMKRLIFAKFEDIRATEA